jgi:RimJ/RimL family protein N-acetyltransferase
VTQAAEGFVIETGTARLRLLAGTLELATAELEDRERFGTLLQADVPPGWPPESLRDALPFFRDLFRAHPDWIGWLGWYALLKTPSKPVLCGSVGFKGPVDLAGMVEIGYSLLPEFQHAGLATEMVRGLLHWARRHPEVQAIEAETMPDNLPSIRVLERTGFETKGQGLEPGSIRYRLRC